MTLSVRNTLRAVCAHAVLLSLLLVPPLARGAEEASGTKEAAPAKPAVAAAAADKTEIEIATARENLKAAPANATLHIRLAYLLVAKGELDEAMRTFDEALKLNARAFDAKTGRGVVLARQGKLKEAEQVLQDALLLNPNPVRTHYELGLVYEKLGNLDKAIAEFKEGIRKHEQGRQ